MVHKNSYRYANYDSTTDTVNFTEDKQAEFCVGVSQKDITVRGNNGEMVRIQKGGTTEERAVRLFARLLAER